jgi:hypothetical protein
MTKQPTYGIFIYEQVAELDFVGPLQLFSASPEGGPAQRSQSNYRGSLLVREEGAVTHPLIAVGMDEFENIKQFLGRD